MRAVWGVFKGGSREIPYLAVVAKFPPLWDVI
jgi:hypothetical protein